ncbi:uncharacterized protein LOC131692134 [Topomyia yanbarensis]|uniref:uncharacterized protein LOC131692134 n=1 Tax=Topomyia yanbarensis TaxID=2498891 RepID=UPI00273ADF1B|nr:uncharacterized protein LOC131692134 [Topomyia yanbarensis]
MNIHDTLIAKYTEHRKIHDQFLQLFHNLQETAAKMQVLASDVTLRYDDIFLHLKTRNRTPSPPPSNKRRKARSYDSPSCAVQHDDAAAIRNKSDPELSSSILNQNVNLPDSDDSFFVLTQSPSRDPLSPKFPSFQRENIQQTPPKKNPLKSVPYPDPASKEAKKPLVSEAKHKKKHSLSLNRFSSTFQSSPESSRQIEQLPMRQKMVTPKAIASGRPEQQGSVIPAGKWTVKKCTPGSLGKMGSSARRTPTSTKKDNMLNRTRLRQTRLRFPDNLNKSTVDDDETYFDDFVIPSPAAFSSSRFLKSVKKKEQSSLVVNKSKVENPQEDDFDIDQTYFSEVEKDLNRKVGNSSTTGPAPYVKTEPINEKKPSSEEKLLVLAKETQPQEDADTSSVLFVKPPPEEVIVISETQPHKNDLFMEAIREQRRKQQQSCQSVLNVDGTGQRNPLAPKNTVPPPSIDRALPTVRRCSECSKHYKFLVHCGLPMDVIRAKMTRNCRECRNVQLHETPDGFWNPEFSPSP